MHNDLQSLGNDLPNLLSLHMVNCRYNKLTDAGVPSSLFALNDLSIVVSVQFLPRTLAPFVAGSIIVF